MHGIDSKFLSSSSLVFFIEKIGKKVISNEFLGGPYKNVIFNEFLGGPILAQN